MVSCCTSLSGQPMSSALQIRPGPTLALVESALSKSEIGTRAASGFEFQISIFEFV
jgi:hypothetical protein